MLYSAYLASASPRTDECNMNNKSNISSRHPHQVCSSEGEIHSRVCKHQLTAVTAHLDNDHLSSSIVILI